MCAMRTSIPLFLLAILSCNSARAASWDALFPASDATPKVLAPDVLSTGDDESHASVFPDGRTLYFLKNTPSFDFYTIVYSELRGGKWSKPLCESSGRAGRLPRQSSSWTVKSALGLAVPHLFSFCCLTRSGGDPACAQ